ncbi:MAG TPA: glycine cleavage T C-terminal barrel domain-containing protein [Candidatus Binataceae bacterium]|nr:glycine cleavage T C-terminal barrel domain-containing protein [Candidatus Binataceae bacterium]
MESTLATNEVAAVVDGRVYRALREGAAWRRLEDRMIIRVVGDDRVSFLHGMCSNDIRGMHHGEIAPALLLTERAHVVADLFIYAESDAFVFEIEQKLWLRAQAHLERFLVADDVEFEELPDWMILDIEGPRAQEIVGQIHPEAAGLEPWRFVDAAPLRFAALPRYDWPAMTVLGDRAAIGSLAGVLSGLAPEADAAVFDTLRIQRGIAQVGIDTNDKTLALEARLERAISLSKGCYIGQETLERATAHGALKKKLYGLRLAAGPCPAFGAAVMLSGREIGTVTSAAQSPDLGALGLAIIHHSGWIPGTTVVIKDSTGERPAIVSELPFK